MQFNVYVERDNIVIFFFLLLLRLLNKENTYKMQEVRIEKFENTLINQRMQLFANGLGDSQKIHDHFPETDTLVRGPFCILTWHIREQNMFPLFIMQRVFRGYLLQYKFDE